MMTPRDVLEDALLKSASLVQADLRTRLQWLEDVALAAEASDLGETGAAAAQDLKAALGAMLQFSRGEMTHESLYQLQMLTTALIGRATVTLYFALADLYADLSKSGPRRAETHQLALAFQEIAEALAQGKAIPKRALKRIDDVKKASEAR